MAWVKKVALAALGAVTATLGGWGVAQASIPAADGTIHGCYSSGPLGNGALYVVDSEESCPAGYSTLNWGQSGGISGYEVVKVSEATTAVSQVQWNATALCPSGKKAIGGGGDGGIYQQYSRPVLNASGDAVGWEHQGRKEPGTSLLFTVNAYAICVDA